jgi:hypothetical protein
MRPQNCFVVVPSVLSALCSVSEVPLLGCFSVDGHYRWNYGNDRAVSSEEELGSELNNPVGSRAFLKTCLVVDPRLNLLKGLLTGSRGSSLSPTTSLTGTVLISREESRLKETCLGSQSKIQERNRGAWSFPDHSERPGRRRDDTSRQSHR